MQPDSQGKTPLTIARSKRHLLIIQFLLKNVTCTGSDLTEMHVACIVGDEEKVRVLSSNRACLRVRDKYGMTPVHYASCEPATLKILVSVIEEDDTDMLCVQDGKGNTPLHYAEITGCEEAVKLLLNCKYNTNITNNEGHTPNCDKVDLNIKNIHRNTPHEAAMLTACCFGQLEIALYLMKEKGCDPTLVGSAGVSPLQLAWNNKHWRVASHLVQAIRERDLHCAGRVSHTASTQFLEIASYNEDALHVACSQGFLEAVHFFHEILKCSLVQPSSQGKTPLTIARSKRHLLIIQFLLKNVTCTGSDLTEVHVACIVGDEEKVRVLSSNRTCLRATDSYGMTPVHYASCEPAALKILVSVIEQDDTDMLCVQDGKGNTPLHYAVITGCEEVVKLLNCKYNTNITNNEGHTPLHVAVKREESKMAVILLNHSQRNPNIQDLTGNTALHIAIIEMSLSCLKPFLNCDEIDTNIQNIQGNTPLHEAIMRQTPIDVVEALTLHKSCNPNKPNRKGMTPLQLSVRSGKIHYVEVLVTSGKCSHEDIVKATEGTLLLHQAVSSNRPKLVSRLIAVQECNVNDTNFAGETALHIACRTKIVQKLVEGSTCDLNVQDQHSNTALLLAACSVSESAEKVQRIAQSERCNPNITNSEGHTPLHVAVRNTNFQSATILLKVAGTPIFAFFYYLISSYQVTKTISTLYCIFIIIVGVLRKSFINIRSTAY